MSKKGIALGFVLLVGTLVTNAFAEEADNTAKFGKSVTIPANTGYSFNVSDDQEVLTVIFDNVVVELSPIVASQTGAQDQTSIQSKLITLRIPCVIKEEMLSVTADIRGVVSADSGVQPRLIVCAGDTSYVAKLKPKKAKVKFKQGSKKKLTENYEGETIDFEERFVFKVTPKAKKPVCQVTLVLVLERDSDEPDSGSGLLVVDSLDLSMED